MCLSESLTSAIVRVIDIGHLPFCSYFTGALKFWQLASLMTPASVIMSQSTPHLAPPSLVSVCFQVLVLPALSGTYVHVGDFMSIHFCWANPFIHNSAQYAWHDVFHWTNDTDRTPWMHRLCCEWYLAVIYYVTLWLFTLWFQHSPLVQYVGHGEFKYSGIASARETDSTVRSHKQVPITDFLKLSISFVKENCGV